ncbi:MAG TPA: hypothetical protein VIW94_11285 [Acidimicrobiia bacterium]
MEAQPFFTTIASLSVSLAGFGAVIGWLRDDPSGWDPINLWRVKTIVRHAFSIAFLCLALVPIYSFSQSDATTIRVGSAFVFLLVVSDIWRVRRPDPAVWDALSLRIFVSTNGILAILAIGNIFWGSLGVLQFMVLWLLTSPAAIFGNFVREMGRSSRPVAEGPGE